MGLVRLFFICMGLIVSNSLQSQELPNQTDMNLILAVDVSSSVASPDFYSGVDEYDLQKKGIITFLKDPEVVEAILACRPDGIGFTYFEWSGFYKQAFHKQVLPWSRLIDENSVSEAAEKIADHKRQFEGHTDVAGALMIAHRIFQSAPFQSLENRVIVTGDGIQNVQTEGDVTSVTYEEMVESARDRLISARVEIDGLAIVNEDSNVSAYYRDHVVSPGHHVTEVRDYKEYAGALKKKLLSQICPLMM